jgi:preprotein translocase subunit SecY
MKKQKKFLNAFSKGIFLLGIIMVALGYFILWNTSFDNQTTPILCFSGITLITAGTFIAIWLDTMGKKDVWLFK